MACSGSSTRLINEYARDRYGNRTNVQSAGNGIDGNPIGLDGIPNLSYDAASNRITTTGFEYDEAGNQLTGFDELGNALRYEYDAANRLQVVKKESDGSYVQAFQFGSTNARLMDTDYQTGFTRMFASAGGTVLAEYHENYQTPLEWTKSYVYLGGSQLSTIQRDGAGGEYTEYNHPDRLGTRLTTNSALGSDYQQAHLPFGKALAGETTGSTNRRFTSYERSAQTGLDYAINRTYDSKQGRFTQADPIGMKAVDMNAPQTLNLYSYCGNDPINQVDPLGLSWISKFFKFVKTIGQIIKNIIKIVVWVAIAVAVFAATISTYGLALGIILGAIIVAGLVIAQHILGIVAKTVWRSIKQSVRENGLSISSILSGFWRGVKQAVRIVRGILSSGFATLLSIYGYFCAPDYGVDGSTRELAPIDELDAACQQHDRDMIEIDALLDAGKITEREWKKLKNKADLKFMKRAILSGNSAAGIYLIGLEITFLLRVVFR